MTEWLEYGFMQRALVAGTLVGLLCAIVGVYVVHKGLAFMGAGIAHAAFGGVALGVWMGLNPVLTAIVFCLVVGWSIAGVVLKTSTGEDTAIGIFFASTMALGILLIGLLEGYQPDLFGYLFGSILAVSTDDLWITGLSALFVFGTLLLFGRKLLFTIFDPEGAAALGIPTTRLYFLLITLVTLTVVVSIKVVGIVLVSALLITPAAAASLLSRRFNSILWISALFGVSSTLLGLLLSFWWDTAPGATIVLLITLLFLVLAAITYKRR